MPQFLSLLSVIIIAVSLFYYLYAFTNGVILLILTVLLILVILSVRRSDVVLSSGVADDDFPPGNRGGRQASEAIAREDAPGRRIWSYFIFFTFITAAFAILFTHQTTEALRSPWESIPPYFFLLYAATVFFILQISRSGVVLSSGILFLFTFLTLSISLIIFPLGSGFDPFIHQATEKIIAATGTITPKPLYYIGQYVLVVFLSKVLGISVALVDKLLVPLLASILIPWSIMNWWKKNKQRSGDVLSSGIADDDFPPGNRGGRQASEAIAREDTPECSNRIARPPIILTFLTLPFFLTPFTTTTPYSFALLFLVVLIFNLQRLGFIVQLILATATLLIHPLVGIPAFLFLIVQYIQKYKSKLLHITCYILCALSIPAAFLLAAQFSSQIHIIFAPQNFLPWLQSIEWHGIYRENRFNAPLDLLYFYGFNIKDIFWFFILTPLILQIKRWYQQRVGVGLFNRKASQQAEAGMVPPKAESEAERERNSLAGGIDSVFAGGHPATDHSSFFVIFLILLTSYVLMSSFLSFNFLIGYEQADYAKRVLDIAQLFLIPFFLLGIHWWMTKIPRSAIIVLLTLAIPASLFLTYPQKIDSYAVSHAFNTSQSDLDAVRWIDTDAKAEDYIVLANQAVSAGAIRELGFKKYYNDIFFYPIPTGSPLYQYYLNMVYKKASSETMREAMQRVSAQRSYFVLNRYWNDFDRILTEAQKNLRLIHSINNAVFIFAPR